MTEKLKTFT